MAERVDHEFVDDEQHVVNDRAAVQQDLPEPPYDRRLFGPSREGTPPAQRDRGSVGPDGRLKRHHGQVTGLQSHPAFIRVRILWPEAAGRLIRTGNSGTF